MSIIFEKLLTKLFRNLWLCILPFILLSNACDNFELQQPESTHKDFEKEHEYFDVDVDVRSDPSTEIQEATERYLQHFEKYFFEFDQQDPFNSNSIGKMYYYILSKTNVLKANLKYKILSEKDLQKHIEQVKLMADSLAAIELKNSSAIRNERRKYAEYFPNLESERGWTFFRSKYYPQFPIYDPYQPSESGSFSDKDHTIPPFSVYAVTVGQALISLTEVALILEAYELHQESQKKYVNLANEVMKYWFDQRFKVHDNGLIGWCYEEFCEANVIHGVQHNANYWAANSNSMMAYAAMNLAKLGILDYLSSANEVVASFKSIVWLEDGVAQWNFGKNSEWWDSQNLKGVESIEDTSHAAWDLYMITHSYIATSAYANNDIQSKLSYKFDVTNADIISFSRTLTEKIINGPDVYRRINGTSPYSINNYRLVGEWAHLSLALKLFDAESAKSFLKNIEEVLKKGETYGYYEHLFDSYFILALADL